MLTGYKYEPISILHSEQVIAWELLSTAEPHIDLEAHFGLMAVTEQKNTFLLNSNMPHFLKRLTNITLMPHPL